MRDINNTDCVGTVNQVSTNMSTTDAVSGVHSRDMTMTYARGQTTSNPTCLPFPV